jgi:excisionase family DNA binding protein
MSSPQSHQSGGSSSSDLDEGLLNVRETAKRLGVHENTVRNWAREGILATARVPGSRFNRFRAEDVERLARDRGNAVTSVERERRTVGPELVTATQLHQWADSRDAQGMFPELIRRLLASTPGVTGLSLRSGDGISVAGWDGRAHAHGAAFVPDGELRFELGVGRDAKRKADADFEKRAQDSLGDEAKEIVFVFLTPRRWPGAEVWADSRRAQGVFADVRAIDADSLEGWLQSTPSVHYWISEQLGRSPLDVQTLERWWTRFQARTRPALPTALFLAGRQAQIEELVAFLDGPPGVIAVQADWHEEAIAFMSAAIEASQNHVPTLLVSTPETWERVLRESQKTQLLPTFADPDVGAIETGKHHVILPLGRGDATSAHKLVLPPPPRVAAAEALRAARFPDRACDDLAALARRSMRAFMRRCARDARIARPAWAGPDSIRTIAPLVLVGRWLANDRDAPVVSRLVEQNWDSIERVLLQWRESDDPPFVKSGELWHVASADDAFLFLSPHLTAADLERWHRLVADVLLTLSPVVDQSTDQRLAIAQLRVEDKHSRDIRAGLADAAALLGALEKKELNDGRTGEDHAAEVVGQLLRRANADESAGLWVSLADVLPRLAEAAPDEFLQILHEDLARPDPVTRLMFQDQTRDSWLTGSSSHAGLLWALETVAWSSEHLLDACRALARLSEIDPGGRLSNRPVRSLQAILAGWIRHTEASLPEKEDAVRAICRERPAVAWELVSALWPEARAVIVPPASPEHRAWAPDTRNVPIAHWAQFIACLVDAAIELAGKDPDRWATLSTRLGALPATQRTRLIGALGDFAQTGELRGEGRLLLWERLRSEIARHRRFSTAEWAMDEQILARLDGIATILEPSARAEQYSYLFDWHPDIPGIDVREYQRYVAKLNELRENAVREVVAESSLDGLRTLALRSPVPDHLGQFIGQTAPEELTTGLLSWLDSDEDALRIAASRWARVNLYTHGAPWLRAALAQLTDTSSARRTALVLSVPAIRMLWDVLADIAPDLNDIYWRKAMIWHVDPADIEHAARELLSRNRAWIAVDVTAEPLQGPDPNPNAINTSLVCDVLEGALVAPPSESQSQAPGYELGLLLDYLENEGVESQRLIQYEYAFFRVLEDIRKPRALFAALGNNADMFVELVCRVYRANNEAPRKLTDEETALANHSWLILHEWRELPGRLESRRVDTEHLTAWVRAAREAFAKLDRVEIGDELIGQLLATSPDGEDGLWPAETVRDLLESIASPHLDSGVHTGVVNDRGFTSRGVFDGGEQERALSARYNELASQTSPTWPRTSRVLRRLAKAYELDAKRHDDEAAVRSNT